ncbi:MAG: hypothetical protein HOP07_10335 [Bacteriovoracaceae bacterium]|nr:hypothetical protein [Bacteriovoracaceae bacterium]
MSLSNRFKVTEPFEEREVRLCSGIRHKRLMKPMLDDNVTSIVEQVSPYVTDSIWFGKMNSPRRRLKINGVLGLEMEKILTALLSTQTNGTILDLHS